MTPAEHAALSAQLARALGWKETYIDPKNTCKVGEPLFPERGFDHILNWHAFDYRDPSVWGPVLEWLIKEHWALPAWNRPDRKYMLMLDGKNCYGTTLPEAIARAAIAVGGGKRQRVEQNEAREVLQP